ncbi:hypothetical protein PRIPAC_90590 [Pristionchus pacificus]|uniref:Uncharacterized protein n=1 Tax=Pristionchus pacificus TaxID=54126 RepID=A0A2A6CXM2_PRIPA|nr:hypothetical protein PRIPAC_90590 [Pristionchus pacificus]|eukprot:PDM82836.1 hypothetical protein PRIPAC_37229 [Pristionchus pacificus]
MIKAIKNGLKKIPLPKYVLQWGVYEVTVIVTFSVLWTSVGVASETAYLLFILTNKDNVVYYEVAMIASQPAIIILLHKCLRRMHANLTRMVIFLQFLVSLVHLGVSIYALAVPFPVKQQNSFWINIYLPWPTYLLFGLTQILLWFQTYCLYCLHKYTRYRQDTQLTYHKLDKMYRFI